ADLGNTGEAPPPDDGAGEAAPAPAPGASREKADAVTMNQHYVPWLSGKWRAAARWLRGIKGPVPELPSFPFAPWHKKDEFIAARKAQLDGLIKRMEQRVEKLRKRKGLVRVAKSTTGLLEDMRRERARLERAGAGFYNRVKEGLKNFAAGNDMVQKTAMRQVRGIVGPLLERAGGEFSADAYRRLRLLMAKAREHRRGHGRGAPLPPELHRQISALTRRLEASPYVLFQRFVLMMDLKWRAENLKTPEGAPVTLPHNLTGPEIEEELERLSALIGRLTAADGGNVVLEAVKKHMALVKETAAGLAERGLAEADALRNPYYFPHFILETTENGRPVERPWMGLERVRPGTEADFRGYLVDPVGSAKDIEGDYVRAMYYHLVQVGAHNWRSDTVRDFFRDYDIMDELAEVARQRSLAEGRAVSWQEVFHSDYEPLGYTIYGADSGEAFPQLFVDRGRLGDILGVELTGEEFHQQLEALGIKGVRLTPGDIREMVVQGAREKWVVPARVAEALRGIERREEADRAAGKGWRRALRAPVSFSKFWKLFVVVNHLRYEINNIVADAEKILRDTPGTVRFLWRAAREVARYFKTGEMTPELRLAVRHGVLDSITAQDMDMIPAQAEMREFETTARRIWEEIKAVGSAPVTNLARLLSFGKLDALGRVNSVQQSAFREGMTRHANFLHNLDRIRNGARPDYAGAFVEAVEAMEDSAPGAGDRAARQAAEISKATFGNYKDLSRFTQFAGRYLMAFPSWQEVNLRYHANAIRNAASSHGRKGVARHAALTAAMRVAWWGTKVAALYMGLMAWNRLMRPEEDDDLSEEDRRRPHITLGRNADGTVSVIYLSTASADALKWFAGERAAQALIEYLAGRCDLATAVSAWSENAWKDV
ncbi:MAG: hypothetical protein LBC26_00250, partial [Oscillospiraceae bacterium]|nr:hypothetical protein [Oscillospiraceae bacterium]